MAKGYVNELMSASRILSHGKITELPFSLAGGQAFSIFIIPKTDSDLPVVVSCKLYQDDADAACPFNVKCWTEPAVVSIPADAIVLANYDVYWGCGTDVEES